MRFPKGILGGMGLTLAILVGLFVGLGTYTFSYGEGWAYMSREPEACINCHIMDPYYDTWLTSSHHHVAVCVDCHLPQEFVPKYIAKAENGWNHSWAFTFQDFHEPIQITPRNARILQANCIGCHQPIVEQMFTGKHPESNEVSCIHCHHDVGHGG